MSIKILAVKLWGRALDTSLKRYSVYYEREGRMWRSIVDAIDEMAAWRKFNDTVDHKNTLTSVLLEQEQEYHGFTKSRTQAEEGQD